tara:strand:- start:119 stop:961 length:843 start_codon:yes stop_codon:yes gene_type:complete
MNIQTLLKEASYLLKKKNIISANLDSEILLSHIIKKNRKYIFLNLKENLDDKYIHQFKNLIKERSLRKPVSYLVEKKNFWKYEFNISKDVLIPRPDTELIVDQALKFTKFKSKQKILDIGVGSGCILLSILCENLDFRGIGIDISKKSIDLCKTNVIKFGLENRVKLFKSNIDNFEYGKYDLIISNPPYIKKKDLKYLEKDVIGFEPKLALDGGFDGVSVIKKVISKSSKLIKKNGKLFLEIAFDQRKVVEKILKKNGFYINKVLRDFAKNERCIISTKL